jgi:hypothetical protein
MKADDTVICFTEVRFLQTYSPLRWPQRPGLFQPFPSLNRSLRPSELFSLINGSLRPLTRTATQLVSLALLTKVLRTRMGKKKSDPTDKNSNEHKYLSLTSHQLFGVILDLGEDLIFCLCLVKSRALVLNVMAENLDALKWWWLGCIYSPNHQTNRWGWAAVDG